MAVPDRFAGATGTVNETVNDCFELARTPEVLMRGAITRDGAGAITSAAVLWPDGTPGTYSAVASSLFPGATDSYALTYGSPVVWTFRQPAVTRHPVTGVVVTLPEIEVS